VFIFNFTITAQNTPVVFVHGMLAGSDTWTNAKQSFIKSGYSDNELHFFDWNTLNQNRQEAIEAFEDFVKKALKKSKSKQISLVGHSAGGALCMSLIHESKIGKKVERYIHVGSMPISKNPNVPTLNLYSKGDLITGGKDYDFENVTNKSFESLDHYEIATDSSAVKAMLHFFGKPTSGKTSSTSTSFKVELGGRVVTMGENEPESSAHLSFYEINPQTGGRQTKTPLATIQTDKDGYWNLEILSRNTLVEAIVESQDKSKRKIHYFFEVPSEKNDLIYFRTLPTTGFAAILFASLPQDDEPCLVVYSASKALIHQRDSLLINEQNIITEELASPQKTPIAFFIFSADAKAEDLTPIKSFGNFPFLSGVNMKLSTSANQIKINFKNQEKSLPIIKSKDGVMVKIVF
jgi:uncharacterized protein YprB with RNaseH-like and TPR domain